MPNPDRLGVWYSVQERLYGDAQTILAGRLVEGAEGPEWFELQHAEFDGIGVLWELQRRLYGDDGAGPMPESGERAPGTLASWRLLYELVTEPVPRVATWRSFDEERRGRATLAWRALSADRTSAIIARARREDVSVNSLLLWALGRTVEPAVNVDRGAVRWMLPVNMRGPIRRSRPTANHSSYIRALTPPRGTPRDVERSVREAIARREHFATWRGLELGGALGAEIVRRFLEQSARAALPWIGMFSNLGRCPPRSDGRGLHDAWIIGAPVTRMLPFACCSVTWHGRLSLSMRAHPVIGFDQRATEAALDRWVDSALDPS